MIAAATCAGPDLDQAPSRVVARHCTDHDQYHYWGKTMVRTLSLATLPGAVARYSFVCSFPAHRAIMKDRLTLAS